MGKVLAVPKVVRIKDKKVITAERKPYCEVCGAPAYGEPHHIEPRGSGGPDIRENLIQLCWRCHYEKVPAGKLSKDYLFEIVARRMKETPEEVKETVRRAKRYGRVS